MTPIEVMECIADYIREQVAEYSTQQKKGLVPVIVYAGYPPIPDNATEKESFIYVLVTSWTDKVDGDFSTAKVELGFSIYDDDKKDGAYSLYNLLEHVRQAMLRKRLIDGRTSLVLPIKGEVVDNQPWPQWQGRIEATYTMGQPTEEELDYGY